MSFPILQFKMKIAKQKPNKDDIRNTNRHGTSTDDDEDEKGHFYGGKKCKLLSTSLKLLSIRKWKVDLLTGFLNK